MGRPDQGERGAGGLMWASGRGSHLFRIAAGPHRHPAHPRAQKETPSAIADLVCGRVTIALDLGSVILYFYTDNGGGDAQPKIRWSLD
jgi:hypothetical protein